MFKHQLFVVTLIVLLICAPAHGNPIAPSPVVITVAKHKDFSDIVEALGTLKANESVELTSAVTELVTKISFKDNERVKKGDVIIEMDAAQELAELAEQTSFTSEAKRQVNRLSPLVKQGAASASALDENIRDFEGAKARLTAIQSRIDQRIIKAPFDGVLGLRNISVGALVQPGSLITTIDDDSVMKLDFSVPEIFLSTLKPNVKIKAFTKAYPNKVFEGKIAYVDSRIDPVTRSLQARALIDNPKRLLKPGLLMQVQLQKNTRKALMIPEEALIANGPDNFVFVINENLIAEKRKVELGARRYGEAEILSGLTDGEKIITHGALRLKPGSQVNIIAVDEEGQTLKQHLQQ